MVSYIAKTGYRLAKQVAVFGLLILLGLPTPAQAQSDEDAIIAAVQHLFDAMAARDDSVLCLYRPRDGRRLSAMIAGCPDITNVTYQTVDEAKASIGHFFRNVVSILP